MTSTCRLLREIVRRICRLDSTMWSARETARPLISKEEFRRRLPGSLIDKAGSRFPKQVHF